MKFEYYSLNRSQSGAVLVVSLIILLMLTILGVSAMSVTTLEEKMSGNTRNANLAMQAAESALSEGDIFALNKQKSIACLSLTQTGCSEFSWDAYPKEMSREKHSWWTTYGTEFGTQGSKDIDGVYEDPRWVAAFRSTRFDTKTIGNKHKEGIDFYEITARGTGGNNNAIAVLSSIVAKRMGSKQTASAGGP